MSDVWSKRFCNRLQELHQALQSVGTPLFYMDWRCPWRKRGNDGSCLNGMAALAVTNKGLKNRTLRRAILSLPGDRIAGDKKPAVAGLIAGSDLRMFATAIRPDVAGLGLA
jgi:hypothetical protein